MSDPQTGPSKKRPSSQKKERARPPIPPIEQIKLWVRSGGRCVYCNDYLLDRYLSGEPFAYDVHSGEMAHIVGWKDSEKSPRGAHPLPEDERNTADNLMLLCPGDHKMVDDKRLLGEFTVERLLKDKHEHEARIQHLTAMSKDRATGVIRMIGAVRGATVELSIQAAQEAVYTQEGRYAVFPFTRHHLGLEIDLTDLPDPQDWDGYWDAGRRIIDRKLQVVNEHVRSGEVRHLSVFGFAPIPLLVYLGYQLDDKIPTSIYQKQRGGDEGWGWPDEHGLITFEGRRVQRSEYAEKVALILSISGTVPRADLPAEIDESFNIYEIRPAADVTPSPDILRSSASLEAFTSCYQHWLAELEVSEKAAREIHLFPAVPLSIAVVCGRVIMRHAHPALVVYHRTQDKFFRNALTVNG